MVLLRRAYVDRAWAQARGWVGVSGPSGTYAVTWELAFDEDPARWRQSVYDRAVPVTMPESS
jgi:hypothetical protein